MNAEIPKTFSSRRITDSMDWLNVVEPVLRLCGRNLPGITENEAIKWINSWRGHFGRRADNPNSFLSILENNDQDIVGCNLCYPLDDDSQSARENLAALQSIPGYEDIDPASVLYGSNMAFDIQKSGLGTRLKTEAHKFIRANDDLRYYFLRTDNTPENQYVVEWNKKLGYQVLGTHDFNGHKKVLLIKDLKPELDTKSEVEDVFKKTPKA